MTVGGKTYVGEVKEKRVIRLVEAEDINFPTGPIPEITGADGGCLERPSSQTHANASTSTLGECAQTTLQFQVYRMIADSSRKISSVNVIITNIPSWSFVSLINLNCSFLLIKIATPLLLPLPVLKYTCSAQPLDNFFASSSDKCVSCNNATSHCGDWLICPLSLSGGETHEALLQILGDINEQDHFGLISFDSSVSLWKETLVKASPGNLEEARAFVKSITARGATDINEAVLQGAQLLSRAREDKSIPEFSASILILLTDGDPTSGVTNLDQIQANVRQAIQKKHTLYCLGFGFDVNYKFLEKMALENGGVARRIYTHSDAALQLKGFYEEVATPLLLEVEVLFLHQGVANLTRSSFSQYYNGSEIVVAGRLLDNSLDTLVSEVQAQSSNAKEMFRLEAPVAPETGFQDEQYIFGQYIERLWAYLTVQQLLERELLVSDQEKAQVRGRALELSIQYNFVTPLTSMVVTKPEDGQSSGPQVAEKPKEEQDLEETNRDMSFTKSSGERLCPLNSINLNSCSA
ncbi:ITIH3 inhibitor, partial [Amia calva]|nr:ITIH3 inhibitor [Amia calva]